MHGHPRDRFLPLPPIARERVVTFNEKISIMQWDRSGNHRVLQGRANRAHRVMRVTIDQYFQRHLVNPNPQRFFGFLIVTEYDWDADDIPVSVLDRGNLRLEIWNWHLPNPVVHLREVLKRAPWLADLVGLAEWFFAMCRGTYEIPQGNNITTGRCSLCASSFFGYPLNNHSFFVCIFFTLDPTTRMKFMAVNLPAFCPFCNARTCYHSRAQCVQYEHVCHRCGAYGHQEQQGVCRPREEQPITMDEQIAEVTEARVEFARNARDQAQQGNLQYRLDADGYLMFYRNNIIRDRVTPRGWGPFWSEEEEYIPPPINLYTGMYGVGVDAVRTFTGLNAPEANAAWVSAHVVFPPNETDELERIARQVDIMRFGRAEHPQRGIPEPALVMHDQVDQRLALREEGLFVEMRREAALVEPIVYPGPLNWAREMNGGPIEANEHNVQGGNEQPVEVQPIEGDRVSGDESGEMEDEELNASSDSTSSVRSVALYEPRQVYPEVQGPREQEIPAVGQPQWQPPAQSEWFTPFTVGNGEDELEAEGALMSAIHPRHHPRTRKIISTMNELVFPAYAYIPVTEPTLKERIAWSHHLLTGDEYPGTFGNIELDVLTRYAVYLRGVFTLLHRIAHNQRSVKVVIVDCPVEIRNATVSHDLTIPSLKLFRQSAQNVWFTHADRHWNTYLAMVTANQCNCFDRIHPR